MKEILICGGLLIDRYLAIDRYPVRGGDGYITGSFDIVGGCAANIAKTVKNLGAVPYVVSALGNDPQAGRIRAFLAQEQFPDDCVKRVDGNTGYCFVFLEPDGERTFLTYKGCESEYTNSLIPNTAEDACGVAAVTGYYLLDNSSNALVKKLKSLKNSNGLKIAFDPSPLADKIDKALLVEMLSISDVVIPNEQEAKILAGKNKTGQWALSCNERGVAVIIKKGASGGALYQNGKKTRYKATDVDIVDTTGAGDSFTGAIAYALRNEIPLEKAVLLAASAAAVTVSIKGPHGYFKTTELTAEAQKIWKEHSYAK